MDRQLVRLPLEEIEIAAGMYLLQVQAENDLRSFRLLRSGIR